MFFTLDQEMEEAGDRLEQEACRKALSELYKIAPSWLKKRWDRKRNDLSEIPRWWISRDENSNLLDNDPFCNQEVDNAAWSSEKSNMILKNCLQPHFNVANRYLTTLVAQNNLTAQFALEFIKIIEEADSLTESLISGYETGLINRGNRLYAVQVWGKAINRFFSFSGGEAETEEDIRIQLHHICGNILFLRDVMLRKIYLPHGPSTYLLDNFQGYYKRNLNEMVSLCIYGQNLLNSTRSDRLEKMRAFRLEINEAVEKFSHYRKSRKDKHWTSSQEEVIAFEPELQRLRAENEQERLRKKTIHEREQHELQAQLKQLRRKTYAKMDEPNRKSQTYIEGVRVFAAASELPPAQKNKMLSAYYNDPHFKLESYRP